MRGKGTFYDPRLNNKAKFPLAVETGDWNVRNDPDMVTSKLPALQFYQLSIKAPMPPKGSFDEKAAASGQAIFNGKANCDKCHVPPIFAEPGWPMHKASEMDVVNHYNDFLGLGLADREKNDLVEYLKSI